MAPQAVIREFELTMRLANNLIRARRKALGLTPAELAALANVPLNRLYGYECMSRRPLRPVQGTWRADALKLAAFFGVAAADLWPDCVQKVKCPKVVTELDAAAVARLAGPERAHFARQEQLRLELPAPDEPLERRSTALELVRLAETHLGARDREIIRRVVCGDETTVQVANDLGVSSSRVAQLMHAAIRELRNHWKREHPDVALPPTPDDWRRRKEERKKQAGRREAARQAQLKADRQKARRERRLRMLTQEQRDELKRRAQDRVWARRTDRLIDVWLDNNVRYPLRRGSATDNESTLTRKMVALAFSEVKADQKRGRVLSIDAWWFLKRLTVRFAIEEEIQLFRTFARPSETAVSEWRWYYDRIL